MKRAFPILLLFAVSYFVTSLVGDEPRAKRQPVGDLLKQLRHKEPDRVCAAAKTLGKLGPAAKDAVPALKELLKNRNGRIRWTAAEALWLLEHKAAELAPVYAELLTAKDADVRAASAWRLGRFGSDARHTVPLLAAALRDESFEVRVQVGQALANLGPYAEPALPALVRALGDEQLDESRNGRNGWEIVRKSPALPALIEMADESIPLLIETFRESASKRKKDNSSDIPSWILPSRVAFAFPAFGGQAVAPLLQALESKDEETRQYVALALREIAQLNGLPETAVDKLEKCLDDPDKTVRKHAARALSWVRPSSTKAVTILVEAKAEFGGINKSDLIADLERMSPHNGAALQLLLRLVEDKDAETALEVYRALAGLDLPADQVPGVWIKALSHPNPEVRRVAIGALRDLGPSAKAAKSALHERFLKEDDYNNRASIIHLLTVIDPDDPGLVPFLMKSMDDRDSFVRLDAIWNLTELGPKAKDALPKIEDRLFNSKQETKADNLDDTFVRDLLTAIVRITPNSAKSTASLLKALRRPGIRSMADPKNSYFIRDVLEDGLQANLPAAGPLLREALKDEDNEVRQSAALVLVRAGMEIDAALPILMEKLWTNKGTYGGPSRFRSRVVELLMRRQQPATPAVAAAWCKAWQTADPSIRGTLEAGLLVLQPEALPHLLEQLRQAKTAQAKRDLAHLLVRFEAQSKQVLPILREELRDSQLANQYAAMQALIPLGPDGADALPELVPLLSHLHPGIRAVAAKTLAGIGRAAKPAVPKLKALLKEDKPEMRVTAANALSQIDPDVDEALAALVSLVLAPSGGDLRRLDSIELPEGLKDRSVSIDSNLESLTRFGERAVPVLAELLDNSELDEWSADNVSAQCGSNARVQAALLLAKLGPEAKSAVPALIRALKDKDPFVREAAASALGRIGTAAKEAAPDFIALLEQQSRFASAGGQWSTSPQAGGRSGTARIYGFDELFDFRSAGRGAVLNRNTGFGYGYTVVNPYSHVRPAYPYDVISVLSRIDSESRSAVPILSEMAKTPGHPRRLPAALALWRMGVEAPDLIPAFTEALETHGKLPKNEHIPLNTEIRECLAELDTQLKPAVGVMVAWLKQRRLSAVEEDQIAMVEALGRLGTDASAAANPLRPLIHGDRWDAKRRVAVALALFRINGDKDFAFPVLREVLLGLESHSSFYAWVDSSSTARAQAARALGMLVENGDQRARALLLEASKGDENSFVRVAALEALARQKQTNAQAMKGLCALLRDPDENIRSAVALACSRLGPRAKSSVPALKVATEDGELSVRQAAKLALACLE